MEFYHGFRFISSSPVRYPSILSSNRIDYFIHGFTQLIHLEENEYNWLIVSPKQRKSQLKRLLPILKPLKLIIIISGTLFA